MELILRGVHRVVGMGNVEFRISNIECTTLSANVFDIRNS